MDGMNITFTLIKHSVLILLLCYGASATCSKKAVLNNTTKTVTFHELVVHDLSTNLSLSYNSKGLGPLFDLADSFMDTVQPKNFGEVFKNDDTEKLTDWKYVVKKYEIPIAVCVGIGLLFAIFMPIVGFCFCCCRCCGKCGGDMKQSEKKSSQHCKVAFMIFLLFTFTVMILCGVLFMFVTNDRINDASDNIVETYDTAVDEAQKMVDNVVKDLDGLISDQVPCIINLLRDNIKDTAIIERIGKPLRSHVEQNVSSVFTLATSTSNRIDKIVVIMNDVETTNSSFRRNATKLKSEMGAVKSDLDSIVATCRTAGGAIDTTCDMLANIELNVKMDFDNLPNIAQYLDDMKKVKDLNLSGNIAKAESTVQNIPDTVITKSKSAIQGLRKFLDDTEKNIRDKGNNITDQIETEVDKIKKNITNPDGIYGQFKRHEFNKYERIRWKVYVALSAVMAFIVFILLCGLTFGSCGYNKDYMPTERSTTSNCGGNCLMAAVGLMFIFSFIMMIFCVLWFATGIHVHLICREARDANLVDNMVHIFVKDNGMMRNISVNEILVNCRKNMPVYRATPYIKDNYNITEKLNMDEMKNVSQKMTKDINFNLKSEKMLTANAEQALNDLINSDITAINFTKFFSILDDSITSKDLTEVIANLSKIATDVKNASTAVAADINKLVTNITNIKDATVEALKIDINTLKGHVEKLQDEIKTIKADGQDLLNKLKSSESYVHNETPGFIKSKVKEFADELFSYVEQGITHVINQVKDNAARCKPIANIYDGVLNTYVCGNLVRNSNGFWLALGWCLLFFIPSIILSVKLAKYFRRMDYTAGMDTIVVDHPPYNDKLPPHSNKGPYSTPGYSHEMRPPPPYTSTQHSNPGYQHV